jgi:hypothetical protein
MGFTFVFFIGQGEDGKWRWVIGAPDGTTALASCAGPSESRRACLQEIAVLKNEVRGMKLREWKEPAQRKARSRRPGVDPRP